MTKKKTANKLGTEMGRGGRGWGRIVERKKKKQTWNE